MRPVVADTAYAIATIRADEARRPADERLFDDPYAALFAAGGAHAAEGTRRFMELPFFCDGIRLRTRYLDDVVRAALADGITQVVLLGVGFDARSLRMPELATPPVRVFEVDLPEQLDARHALLAAAKVAPSPRAVPVAIDLTSPELEGLLATSLATQGFRAGAPALFVWEGVTAYLDGASVDRCLAAMARVGGPGSRAVFDFGGFLFDPETVAERTARLGFSACDELGMDALWRRYLPGEPHENAWVARVAVARV